MLLESIWIGMARSTDVYAKPGMPSLTDGFAHWEATTIGGLLPLALAGGPLWEGMAWCMIFGLMVATLLTLLVVPVFYTFFDDARAAFTGIFRQALSKRRSPAATETG